MLHELLLALVGYAGELFVLVPAAGGARGRMEVAAGLPLAHEAERHRLNQLVAMGHDYRELEGFVQQQQDAAFTALGDVPAPDSPPPSLYRRALATGLSEVLASYRGAVLRLEQQILHQPDAAMALAKVHALLSEFMLVLPALSQLLEHVLSRHLRGGPLLRHLTDRCCTGSVPVQTCLKRLLWHCHQVWYKQTSAWMLHGMLLDQGHEYFIMHTAPDPTSVSAVDEPTDDASTSEWHHAFKISLEALPSGVSVALAETILFVGRAVRVLRRPSAAFERHSETLLPETAMREAAASLAALQAAPEFHRLSLERTVESIRVTVAAALWALVVERADLQGHVRALKDYCLLAKGDFFHLFFEDSRAIMALPPRPSSELDLNVPFQQAAIRSTAGDDKFFDNVKLRLALPTAGARTTAAGGVVLDSHVGVDEPTGTTGVSSGDTLVDRMHVPAFDGWDGLTLEYVVCWPLGLLLTPTVLRRYNTVFQYLVRLKRAQLLLEDAWATLRTRRRLHVGFPASRARLLQLRQHMAHLVTNLQIYFQFSMRQRVHLERRVGAATCWASTHKGLGLAVNPSQLQAAALTASSRTQSKVDVIEAEYKTLEDKVAAAHDFVEVERAHHQYLSALLSQTFLDVSLVSQSLASVLSQCLALCRTVQMDDGSSSADAANDALVDELFEQFLKSSNTLYTCFRSNRLAGSARAPFLRQLLLRLNYNNFYSDEAARRLLMRMPQMHNPTGPPPPKLQL